MKPKLQKVCNHYLQGMSMRQALLAVGYSDAYASHYSGKFLHNRECQRYIRARQQQEADAAMVDGVFLLKQLEKIILDPNSTNKERNDALKILNDRQTRMVQVSIIDAAKDAATKTITINFTEAK